MYKFISTCLIVILIFNASIQTSDIEHEYWAQAVQDESEDDESYQSDVREVAINTTLYVQLQQFFTHDGSIYNGIEYSEFCKKYGQITDIYINKALRESKLNRLQRDDTYSYTIVGEQDVDFSDSLYDCQKARDTLINLVNRYIDKNYDAVRAACVGVPLQESRSKVVWAPGCCDIQLHKDCFKQCKQNNMRACLNSFCAKREWNADFYCNVLKSSALKKHYVPFDSIRDTDCPLCMEPLLVDKAVEQANTTKKRDNTDIIDHTAQAKKTRFL
ncbi:hypothetical protein [Candidatus Chromulinivorax destructor]|uniref:Uncharacterized protein n=1 Tax=Candidatus Chromulinivorax destructor TaxID=2066483 RepID=A0A345ZBX3_9BACT|nr:hypothetical protein [Candidatus Chromulinivorax destructor]AXK60790.1 hypothetical protein C0J27_03515 [Candidatus Chromulinivorax destructor]